MNGSTLTQPGSGSIGAERTLLSPAAALSFAAALIHASVAPAHFGSWWAFGVFFVVVAAFQLVWAELVRRGEMPRRGLVLGAAVNLAIAAVWLGSRTVGLPIGPEAGRAEGVGLHDVLATLDEVGIAILVAAALVPRGPGRATPRAIAVAGWALAAVSFVGAFLGGHGES
jgi:hypothetical protein